VLFFYLIAVAAIVIGFAAWREIRVLREQRRHVESKKNEPLRGVTHSLRASTPESAVETFLDTVSPVDDSKKR
jgi:hypothetical protein